MQSNRSSEKAQRIVLDGILDEQQDLWKQGQRVLVEELLGRNPAIRDDPAAIVDLVYHEFLLRREAGLSASPEDFIRRFPEHAELLVMQFAVEEAMRPMRDETGAFVTDSAKTMDETVELGRDGLHPPVQDFGAYRIIKRLGQGGMAVVYLARDTVLDRLVALQVSTHRI